tara:strand:- start:195 stop:365 length:171 start_codon:yes stop_codon:yes gene_type:complete
MISKEVIEQRRIEQLELMLRLEQAKVQHLKNLVVNFQENRTTGNQFKLFEYVDSIA